MQFERHKSQLERLRNITARVKSALLDGNIELVERLALEHKIVMNKLNREGLSTNVALIDLVKEARDEVGGVMAEIAKRRDKLGRQLVTMGKGKKMACAYARNG